MQFYDNGTVTKETLEPRRTPNVPPMGSCRAPVSCDAVLPCIVDRQLVGPCFGRPAREPARRVACDLLPRCARPDGLERGRRRTEAGFSLHLRFDQLLLACAPASPARLRC